MINVLSEMQDEFSKINMQKLDSIYQLVEADRSASIEFAKDPDGFVFKHLNGEYLPNGTHFHIQIDGTTFPDDQVEMVNRLVFFRVINLPENLRQELTSLVKAKSIATEAKETKFVTPGGLCRGCRHCAIAIVNWVN